jgi:hypothetical protein
MHGQREALIRYLRESSGIEAAPLGIAQPADPEGD